MFGSSARIVIIAGHYGSGKTEFAVNLAFFKSEQNEKVTLVDLDIVNPYFCSREQERELEAAGIELIAPSPQCRMADVPALPADVAKIFVPDNGMAILDAGGDGAGAKVLSRYMPQLKNCGYDMWLVLNANRPQTADAESALCYIKMIETASRLKFTGIVNNTHLCGQTTVEDIKRGSEVAASLSEITGLPLICSTAPGAVLEKVEKNAFSEPLFPLDIRMKKPWEM